MKKKIGFISLVLLIVGFISCSPLKEEELPAEQISDASFSIGGISIEYTEVEVTDGTNGNVVVLNAEQATGLYNSLKDIVFEKVTPPSLSPGWCYSVKFMKNGIITEDIVVKDANTITYKDAVYQTKSGTIDLDYFSSLLNYSFRAEVISTEDALLVAPSEDSNEAKSSDRIAINLRDTQLLNKEGLPITEEEVKTGDYLVITYNGVIAESYPAQITASRIEVVDHNKLIDAYAALIDDIYKEDNGLNGDITTIAFDTTDWKLLTDIEKEIILEGVKTSYSFDVVPGPLMNWKNRV
jgi:hypothetical protein